MINLALTLWFSPPIDQPQSRSITLLHYMKAISLTLWFSPPMTSVSPTSYGCTENSHTTHLQGSIDCLMVSEHGRPVQFSS